MDEALDASRMVKARYEMAQIRAQIDQRFAR